MVKRKLARLLLQAFCGLAFQTLFPCVEMYPLGSNEGRFYAQYLALRMESVGIYRVPLRHVQTELRGGSVRGGAGGNSVCTEPWCSC